MNFKKFEKKIDNLPSEVENRDLEEYLLALLGLVLKNKSKKINYRLVYKLIFDSFTTEPIDFDESWLSCIEEPEVSSDLIGIDFTIEVLKFQISEVHKMKGKQLQDEFKYFGVESETGHSWYNFDPFSILECGIDCINGNSLQNEKLDWSFFGNLLEYGRIYE